MHISSYKKPKIFKTTRVEQDKDILTIGNASEWFT